MHLGSGAEQPHPLRTSSTCAVIPYASDLLSMCTTPMAQLDPSTRTILWCNSQFNDLCKAVGLDDASIGLELLQNNLLYSIPGPREMVTLAHGVLNCSSQLIGHGEKAVMLWVFEKETWSPPGSGTPDTPFPEAKDFTDPGTRVHSLAADGKGGARGTVVNLWHKYGQAKRPANTSGVQVLKQYYRCYHKSCKARLRIDIDESHGMTTIGYATGSHCHEIVPETPRATTQLHSPGEVERLSQRVQKLEQVLKGLRAAATAVVTCQPSESAAHVDVLRQQLLVGGIGIRADIG